MIHILLIEDEQNVSKPLEDYLIRDGFRVTLITNFKDAVEKMANLSDSVDLILLDWMLPDGQGIELLKQWRLNGLMFPVILLTARADLVDKVVGLELGANDYLTKPFEPRELVARIRVQLRQVSNKSMSIESLGQQLESSGIRIDLKTREAFFENQPVSLAKTEFELLKVFLENPNQVFSREELLKRVWGYDQYPTTRTVDTHVLQLRQKTKASFFETSHGIGYRFKPNKI